MLLLLRGSIAGVLLLGSDELLAGTALLVIWVLWLVLFPDEKAAAAEEEEEA
jgi:hypothetical protein